MWIAAGDDLTPFLPKTGDRLTVGQACGRKPGQRSCAHVGALWQTFPATARKTEGTPTHHLLTHTLLTFAVTSPPRPPRTDLGGTG